MRPSKLKSNSRVQGKVLGAQTFAAITSVEGLRLGSASRKRLETMKANGLTPAQSRDEVLKVYMALADRK
jgi:hypothetical protein